MRHGRAKAARKTLQYFERVVNLKSKPYYSVLLDATFLIAMIRITRNDDEANNKERGAKSENTIVSRIERVLQVNGRGKNSFSGFNRDERLSGVVRDNGETNAHSQNYDTQEPSAHVSTHDRFNVRYFIPQEAIDEIEMILNSIRERLQQTKKEKKKKEYQAKAIVFEDALAWIKKNKSKNKNYKGNARCELLPRLEAQVEAPTKKHKKETKDAKINSDDSKKEEAPISASDAVRRHISRDDGREDPETNQIVSKKQQSAFSRTFIVASQEEDLLDDLRMLGTVPIMRCTNNASVLILENPSKKGQRSSKGKEQTKWKGALQNPAERALVDAAWEAQKKDRVKIMGLAAPDTKRGQNTKARGPNPLSCKRKRADSQQQQQLGSGESKSKKRRARAQRNKLQAAGEKSPPKE